jgi:hypothetical protein
VAGNQCIWAAQAFDDFIVDPIRTGVQGRWQMNATASPFVRTKSGLATPPGLLDAFWRHRERNFLAMQ